MARRFRGQRAASFICGSSVTSWQAGHAALFISYSASSTAIQLALRQRLMAASLTPSMRATGRRGLLAMFLLRRMDVIGVSALQLEA